MEDVDDYEATTYPNTLCPLFMHQLRDLLHAHRCVLIIRLCEDYVRDIVVLDAKKVSTHPPQFVDGAYLRRVCLSFDAARVVPTVFVTESSSRVVMSQLPWASVENADVGEVNA